jgi:hypothetical protein
VRPTCLCSTKIISASWLLEGWSLTNETCGSTVSREGEGEEWSRGLESGTCMKLPCGFMRETYSDIHLEIIKVSLVTVKQAWI